MRKVNVILALFTLLFFLQTHLIVAQRPVIIVETPPWGAPHRDMRPPCPGRDFDWVEGRWVWDDYYRRRVWMEGYWQRRTINGYCESDCCHRHEHRYKKQKYKKSNHHNYGYSKNKHYDD